MTTISLPLLDRVDVASPCHARWEDMTGDERIRHCAECNLKVHNISALSRDDAEALLRASAGDRLCIRLFRRTDGTILTQDCPTGVAALRAKARRALVRVAALLGLIGAAGVAAASTSRSTWGDRVRLRALRPFSVVCEWIAPTAAPPPALTSISAGTWTSGSMCSPYASPPPPQAPANPAASAAQTKNTSENCP
jgi:hypothetical protein